MRQDAKETKTGEGTCGLEWFGRKAREIIRGVC